MRLREFLMSTAVMSFALVNVNAIPPAEIDCSLGTLGPFDGADNSVNASTVSVPLPPAPSPLVANDKVLGEAYYDTLGILSEDNACSDFFGGTTGSVMVFNRLMGQVRRQFLATTIGMRMSGKVTLRVNAVTKTRYRLFDNVTVNSNGPFYRRKVLPSDPSVPGLGGFEPNTKEIRVLILLHELGHLMKGDDGNWLLRDDGKAESVSLNNSQKIEDACGDQIKGLSRSIPK